MKKAKGAKKGKKGSKKKRKKELAVPAPPETETALVEPRIFAPSPEAAIDQMQRLVKMMHGFVEKADRSKYIANIQGKDYPKVTWWTTIALPLQLIPRIVWTRRLDTEKDSGYAVETWMSRAEVVHTPSGKVVTSGEAICSLAEGRWIESYAINAMSQTRAIGRAFRGPLAGLAVMAGLEETPAEEKGGAGRIRAGDVPRTVDPETGELMPTLPLDQFTAGEVR